MRNLNFYRIINECFKISSILLSTLRVQWSCINALPYISFFDGVFWNHVCVDVCWFSIRTRIILISSKMQTKHKHNHGFEYESLTVVRRPISLPLLLRRFTAKTAGICQTKTIKQIKIYERGQNSNKICFWPVGRIENNIKYIRIRFVCATCVRACIPFGFYFTFSPLYFVDIQQTFSFQFLSMANCWFSNPTFRLHTNTEPRIHLFACWTEWMQWMLACFGFGARQITEYDSTFAQRVTSCAAQLNRSPMETRSVFCVRSARCVSVHFSIPAPSVFCSLWRFQWIETRSRHKGNGNWCLRTENDTV